MPYDPKNPVFYVPYRQKGERVIGREEALHAVRQQLTAGRRTSIGQTASFQGLGGLGKTQLAVEYAYRFRDEYPSGVIWISADQDIDAQLTELAEKAKWIAPESEHKYKLEIARHRLKAYSDCLIVFDNLISIDDINDYLPEPEAEPHILVTSRTEHFEFIAVPIDPLDNDLSMRLLIQEAGREPLEDDEIMAAHDIAQALGGLPLALELAGAYLYNRPTVSWQQYNALLKNSLKAALPGRLASFTKHEADLYSTLKINEDFFSEEPKLKEILDLLTWSGPAAMGSSLMRSLLDVVKESELTNALSLGLKLRLLQEIPGVSSYAIHRLVREVRREDIPLESREEWLINMSIKVGDWFQNRRLDFADLPAFESEIDHLRAWLEHTKNVTPLQTARLTWLQGYPPYHRGRYSEAKVWVEKALALYNKSSEKNKELLANLLNDFGNTCGLFGDYNTQLENIQKALELRLELFGEVNAETARSLSNVGAVLGELGDYKQELEYNEKALKIRMAIFGEKHPDTAVSLNNVGFALGHLGDNKQKLEYYEKALKIYLDLFGEKHPDTARSLNNIGTALGYKQGLKHYEKALKIYLDLFGGAHPDTARSLNNVGVAWGELGDYKQEYEYNLKALKVHLDLFGETHPDTARSLNNIGVALGHLGDYKQELEYYEKTLKIYLNLFGKSHPDTLVTVNNLAHSLIQLNRIPQAYHVINSFMENLPQDRNEYQELLHLKQQIPGLSHNTGKSHSNKRKTKKKHR